MLVMAAAQEEITDGTRWEKVGKCLSVLAIHTEPAEGSSFIYFVSAPEDNRIKPSLSNINKSIKTV